MSSNAHGSRRDSSHSDGGQAIVERCPARAALAGNPSDGFGGAVVSIPVRSVWATVALTPADRFELCHSPTDDDTFASFSALTRHVDRYGYAASRELVAAALRRFARHRDLAPTPCAIDVVSSIPRSVGLAGSSAIIIATLRAVYRHAGLVLPDPDELASLALAVEADELGHAAGLQDRVVQAYDELVLMRFGEPASRVVAGLVAGTYSTIDEPVPGSLFVAARVTEAEPSQRVHGDLRARFLDGDRGVHKAMEELASLAQHAASAIIAGDHAALGYAIDRSFDVRRAMIDLRPGHVEMIDVARRSGAHANYAGSGGAITVFTPDPDVADAARSALERIGCTIVPIEGRPAPNA